MLLSASRQKKESYVCMFTLLKNALVILRLESEMKKNKARIIDLEDEGRLIVKERNVDLLYCIFYH